MIKQHNMENQFPIYVSCLFKKIKLKVSMSWMLDGLFANTLICTSLIRFSMRFKVDFNCATVNTASSQR